MERQTITATIIIEKVFQGTFRVAVVYVPRSSASAPGGPAGMSALSIRRRSMDVGISAGSSMAIARVVAGSVLLCRRRLYGERWSRNNWGTRYRWNASGGLKCPEINFFDVCSVCFCALFWLFIRARRRCSLVRTAKCMGLEVTSAAATPSDLSNRFARVRWRWFNVY